MDEKNGTEGQHFGQYHLLQSFVSEIRRNDADGTYKLEVKQVSGKIRDNSKEHLLL